MKRLISWLHSIHLNRRSDPCHSSALCPQLFSMALKVRLQIIYMAYHTLRGLPASFQDHFLPLSPFLCRLLSILQIHKAHPYFRAFVPTAPFQEFSTPPSKPLSHFLLMSYSSFRFQLRCYFFRKMSLDPLFTTKPSSHFILPHSIFYFSA